MRLARRRGRGGRRLDGRRSAADPVALGPDADPESVARKILLDALTGQARSRQELRDQAGQARRARRAGRAAARPVHRGRAGRRRGVRPGLGGEPAAQSRAGPTSPGPGAATQGRRRRDGAGRPRRARPGRRGGGARGCWSARSCARCAGSTGSPRPAGWPACSLARAIPPGLAFAVVREELGAVDDEFRHDGPMTVAPLHRLPPGPVDLAAVPTDRDARLRRRQDQGQGRPVRARRRAVRPPGAAVGRAHHRLAAPGPAGAPGHGHLRQGRGAAPHRRPGRPPGREDHQLQGADGRGAQAPFPVADPQRRAPTPATSGSSTGPTTRTC